MKTLSFDFDNVAGLSLLYAIPVSSFPLVTCNGDGTCSIGLAATDSIISIPIYRGDAFSHIETQELEDGGEMWDVAINGIIPKRCALNEASLASLERGDWLVLSRDANGVVSLSGTSDVPLKFKHTRSSGSSGEINGSSFTFFGKQAEPSKLITTDITVI